MQLRHAIVMFVTDRHDQESSEHFHSIESLGVNFVQNLVCANVVCVIRVARI